MGTLRKSFNQLVGTMQKYSLYELDDEVGRDLDSLSNLISEIEKRMICVLNTSSEINDAISGYTERVDNDVAFVMSVNDHDSILRGARDIDVALDLNDSECIENNWYELFVVKEELSSGGIPYKTCDECNIKEEETVMTKMENGVHLCCDCKEPPTYQCSKPETFDKVNEVIQTLKTLDHGNCVDGETMLHILEQIGMTDQMLRQLIMSNPESDTKDLLAEKIEISNNSVRGLIEK
jgi:hypothetical protein